MEVFLYIEYEYLVFCVILLLLFIFVYFCYVFFLLERWGCFYFLDKVDIGYNLDFMGKVVVVVI